MNTVALALRNLLRNRRRSLTTLLAMVIGLVAILLFGGYRSNIVHGMETGFVQASGHLQIQHTGFFLEGGDNPAAYGIANYARIIDAVQHDPVLAPMLAVVTPSLQLGGIAGNFSAGVSRTVIASGFVAEERNRMLGWNDYNVHSYARPLPLAGTSTDTVVIGMGVARKLQLCALLHVPECHAEPAAPVATGGGAPADLIALSRQERTSAPASAENRIELLAATARGAPNVASLNVIEARNMGLKAIDDVYLGMHLAQAQRLIYGAITPQVTSIQIQLQHTGQMPAARARLAELLARDFPGAPLEILDFRTLNPMFGQSIQFMNSMFGFIATLIGVIVLFTIGNTMSTAVVERTVEIGTLRAMGLRRSGIRRLFLWEGALLGLIGSAGGMLLALVIAYFINHSGLEWIPPGYSYAYLILVRIWQDPALLLVSMFGLVIVTVLSAWWPANRASRMMIVDALRHV